MTDPILHHLETIANRQLETIHAVAEVRGQLLALDARLSDAVRRVAKLEDTTESSGAHDIALLEQALREKRLDDKQSRHDWKMWALGIVAALVTSGCGGAIALVAGHYLGGKP